MPTLLKKLTKHTKGQTRDALRMQVSAYNGLAGLHILKDDVCTNSYLYIILFFSLNFTNYSLSLSLLSLSLSPSPSLPPSVPPPAIHSDGDVLRCHEGVAGA